MQGPLYFAVSGFTTAAWLYAMIVAYLVATAISLVLRRFQPERTRMHDGGYVGGATYILVGLAMSVGVERQAEEASQIVAEPDVVLKVFTFLMNAIGCAMLLSFALWCVIVVVKPIFHIREAKRK